MPQVLTRAEDERSHLSARYLNERSVANDGGGALRLTREQITDAAVATLSDMGIHIGRNAINSMLDAYKTGQYAFDTAAVAPLTTPSVITPAQFLQAWLPGFVNVITAVRKIDLLVGITTQGNWEDEEVIQGIMEYTGAPVPYSDAGNTPLSNWNVNWERYNIVRFEEGIEVGKLQEARAARIRVNTAEAKRNAAAMALEINRNAIGFFGYNSGANRTFGLLNAEGLPAYSNVATGASSSTLWSSKTFLEIIADIREVLKALRTQSLERVDPTRDSITIALATSVVDYLSVVSDFGNSVRDWLTKTYPNVRIESVPEFIAANGGANVMYAYAETVADSGSDDQRTFLQVVPQKFMTVGVQQRIKDYAEAYSNATAGVILKRPYAVVRRSGL